MKQASIKSSNRLLSISGSLSFSPKKRKSKRQSEPKLGVSCPEVIIATRNFSLPEEEEEEVVPVLDTNGSFAAGFLSSFNDSAMSKLENKIEARNKQRNQLLKTPNIVRSIETLRTLFPDFPQHMIDYLVARYDGNCAEVYDFMISRDWKPLTQLKCRFDSTPDIHFTTSYYHGLAPSQEQLSKIFAEQPIGSFFTFYRPDKLDNGETQFKYFVCFINRCGEITEKPMRVPNIAPVLRAMLGLINPINSPLKTSTNILPGLIPSKKKFTD